MDQCNSPANKRKTTSISHKINAFQILVLCKKLETVCNTKFSSQVFTVLRDNTWHFRLSSKSGCFIRISFSDSPCDHCSYITIHDFDIPSTERQKNHDRAILKAIIKSVEGLDFEQLLFRSKNLENISLCSQLNFRELDDGTLYLNLRPKFHYTIKKIP